MSVEQIPIKSILVFNEGVQVGNFVGIDFHGSGFELSDVGANLQLTLSGNSPGGSSGEFQYNDGAGGLAGSTNFTFNTITGRPTLANNLAFANGANTGVLAWAPTGARTLTLPDATDTIVGRATTDTLTNKSISAATNTLTIAAGAANTVQVNDGSNELAAATNVLAGANFLSIGTPTATVGALRLTNNTKVVSRNAADTANLDMIYVDVSDNLRLWAGVGAAYGNLILDVPAAQSIVLQDASVFRLIVKSASINCSQKLGGDGSGQAVPFRFMSTDITKNDATDLTLSTAQYECVYLHLTGTPGGAFNVIAPNSEDSTYCVINFTNQACTIMKAAGTGVVIAASRTAWVRHNGSDYVRTTADAAA